MTDRGEGASLLPYMLAGVTGSDDDNPLIIACFHVKVCHGQGTT